MLVRICILALLGMVASCTPMHVVTRHPTIVPFASTRHPTLVLTPLTSSTRAVRAGEDLPRRIGAIFGRSNMPILEERSLAERPPHDAFLVRISLGDSRSGGQSGERALRTFEVTVFAVEGAPLERVATEAGIVPMIDVTGRVAILRQSYDITIQTDYGSRAGSADEDAAYDESVRVLSAELLYAALVPDLQRAIDSAPASAPPSEINPSADTGGEGAMVVH